MGRADWSTSSLIKLFLQCLKLLNRRDRVYVALSAIIQFSLVFLDLAGLLLIGGVIAIATSAVSGSKTPELLSRTIEVTNLSTQTPQVVATILALVAAFLLVLKSFLSYYFGLRNYAFLASRESKISTQLAKRIFNQQITKLGRFTTPQYQHALTLGCSSVMGGVIGQTLTLLTETFLQLSMLITLFYFSPFLTLVCIVFFSSLFLILNFVQGKKARKWGVGLTEADVDSTTVIADAIGSYREIVVSGRRQYFIDKLERSRSLAANYQVNKAMLTQFSKYAFETSIVVSGLGVSAFAFLTKPAIEAASLVAIFLTAATRIAPSVLKLQQGILQLKGAAGATELFFEIENSVNGDVYLGPRDKSNVLVTLDLNKGVQVFQLSYNYPGQEKYALHDISFEVLSNHSLAIVGPSGAGKSTLVDLILGVIQPSYGSIKLFNLDPETLLESRLSKVAYVPQSVYMATGSILDNVALGISPEQIDVEKVWEVLKMVQLDDWVSHLEEGIHSQVGERGTRISGGQRQRLGIARALYQEPILLVLDEATSSLDAESEYEVSKSLELLRGQVTTLVIAHRLSTVQKCDQVIYLENGRFIAQGTFDELRDSIPNFDRQAELMGITRQKGDS